MASFDRFSCNRKITNRDCFDHRTRPSVHGFQQSTYKTISKNKCTRVFGWTSKELWIQAIRGFTPPSCNIDFFLLIELAIFLPEQVRLQSLYVVTVEFQTADFIKIYFSAQYVILSMEDYQLQGCEITTEVQLIGRCQPWANIDVIFQQVKIKSIGGKIWPPKNLRVCFH